MLVVAGVRGSTSQPRSVHRRTHCRPGVATDQVHSDIQGQLHVAGMEADAPA
jgi:hypothetical protein